MILDVSALNAVPSSPWRRNGQREGLRRPPSRSQPQPAASSACIGLGCGRAAFDHAWPGVVACAPTADWSHQAASPLTAAAVALAA